jgi:hypothetical protein
MNGNPAGASITVVPGGSEQPAEAVPATPRQENEFHRFEALTSTLTQVPKKELDKKRERS